MSVRRHWRLFASQAEILRSYQRDNQYVQVLSEYLIELLHIYHKYKICRTLMQTDVPAKLIYFVLTSGIGNQTLGEEYTGIVQANLKTLQVQPLSIRIAVALVECFGKQSMEKLLMYLQFWINNPHCTLTSEAFEYFNNLSSKLHTVIPLLILLHRGIFYITGRYPTIGKRLFNIDYAKVYGKRPSANVNWGIKLLGLIILVQCALRMWQLELSGLGTHEIDENVMESQSMSKCQLCLERTPTTATVCGHLFCWVCIVEWLHTQYQCPLCRERVSPSRIVHLMNL